MTFLLRYWKQIAGLLIVLALAGGLYAFGYYTKAVACEAAMLGLENAQLEAQKAEIEYWQRRAYEADEALEKALDAPKAAPKQREVVRENPSDCRVPAPVDSGLRDAIRNGNKTVSG